MSNKSTIVSYAVTQNGKVVTNPHSGNGIVAEYPVSKAGRAAAESRARETAGKVREATTARILRKVDKLKLNNTTSVGVTSDGSVVLDPMMNVAAEYVVRNKSREVLVAQVKRAVVKQRAKLNSGS